MEEEEGVGHSPTLEDAVDELHSSFNALILEFGALPPIHKIREILDKWTENQK